MMVRKSNVQPVLLHQRKLVSNKPVVSGSSGSSFRIYAWFFLKLVVGLAVSYAVGTFLFTETYVTQVTTVADIVQPLHRKGCSLTSSAALSPVTGNQILPRHHNQRHIHLALNRTELKHHQSKINSSVSNNQKLRIGMLMLYSNEDGNWGDELMNAVIQNREHYCLKHNYVLVTANDLIDKSRPTAWSKLRAMDHFLHRFDYLMYIDMDIVIMNPNIPLTVFIDASPQSDFIMTEDWNGVNTGAWIAKNTPFSHWFLQTAWNQTQLIAKTSFDGKNHPFEYEQRSFHFLLHTPIWHRRQLPRYRGDSVELQQHFFILPQCSFNSYIMYPYYWLGDREKSHYADGDFLVHFAGKKGRVKTNLMHHFLEIAP